MILNLIVAVSENNVIGFRNRLPWHLPADLRHFSMLTTGHSIIMGRKTFESLGKPLAKRRNLVITRNRDYPLQPGMETVSTLDHALREVSKEEEAFIIGGGHVYEQVLERELADILYPTRVHATFEGDSFFPEVDPAKWTLLSAKNNKPDAANSFSYTFEMYSKKKK